MYPKSLLSRRTRATNRIQAIPARAQWWQSIVLTHRVQVHCGLDRLHTFVIKYVRTLCTQHGVTATRDKPLHSLFGEYVKRLRDTGHVESEMAVRILKSSISMLEAIERIERMTGRKLDWRYVDEARKGDHICYISNLGKFQSHYPNWKITRGLDAILEEIIASQRAQLAQATAR